MASQALYRRYRSQTFDELVGQEHIVQTLRNALADGRLAHAYLFTGPRGVGKTSVARLLAKAVNCSAAQAARPCGVCESCVEIAEGRSVDVIEMDAASHTSVEDAREIIERVQFRPSKSVYKVYVIDEVHMLSTAAFNALLKTLEEPPGHALFILATTESHKIPATILSRCQRFTFSRHGVASIAQHLHNVASNEGITLEAGVAEAIARAATGSMRDALSVLDQLMAYGGRSVSLAQVQDVLGATEAQEVVALVDHLLDADLPGALRVVATVTDQGADLRQFARDVVERLRTLMLLKAGGEGDRDVTGDERAELDRQVQASDLGSLLRWVKLFSALDFQIRTSAIPQLPLEMAIVEALAAPVAREASVHAVAPARPAAQRPPPARSRAPAPPAVQAQAPGEAAPGPVADLPSPAPAPPAMPEQAPARSAPRAAPSAHPVVPDEGVASANADAAAIEQIESTWPDILEDVRVYNRTLLAVLNSGVRPIDVQDGELVLEVASEFLRKRLEQPQMRQIVERALKKRIGADYRIRCVVEAQRRENPNLLREQIRNSRKDPLVRAAINIFDADIVAVESDQQGE